MHPEIQHGPRDKPYYDMTSTEERISIHLMGVLVGLLTVGVAGNMHEPAWAPWPAIVAICLGLFAGNIAVRILTRRQMHQAPSTIPCP